MSTTTDLTINSAWFRVDGQLLDFDGMADLPSPGPDRGSCKTSVLVRLDADGGEFHGVHFDGAIGIDDRLMELRRAAAALLATHDALADAYGLASRTA